MMNLAGLCPQGSACSVQVLAQGGKNTSVLQLILWRDVPCLVWKAPGTSRVFYKCHGPSAGRRNVAINSSTCPVEGSSPQHEAEITKRRSRQIRSCQLSTINQFVGRNWRAVPSHSSVLQLGTAPARTPRESYFMAT